MQPDLPQPDNAQPERPTPPEQPVKKQSFVRRYRWLLVSLLALIILGVTSAVFLYAVNSTVEKTQSNITSPDNTTNSATPVAKEATATNTWKGSVSPTAIPLGDGKVSSSPKTGYVYSCTTSFRGGGARHAGSWINDANNTWNAETKIAVQGSVSWPNASYSVKTSGSSRVITTNDLPQKYTTGIYPISRNDPAYQYDTNPNAIGAQSITYTLPLNPAAASAPSCVDLGPIGVMSNGALLYNALDDAGRDAVAHETQDSCNGHPDGSERYHYHDVSSCLQSAANGTSTLVGYAIDGYGIYVERDSKGNLPTNADLDACHGRTSTISWDGKQVNMYHYSATAEYPYTVGCYHGTPIQTRRGPAR